MRRFLHVLWLSLLPACIVGATIVYDFHNQNLAVMDNWWRFARYLAGGYVVFAGIGIVNAVRKRAKWWYIFKLLIYSFVTAVGGAYGIVLADYNRAESVDYIRLLHVGAFMFGATFLILGVHQVWEQLEHRHLRRKHHVVKA